MLKHLWVAHQQSLFLLSVSQQKRALAQRQECDGSKLVWIDLRRCVSWQGRLSFQPEPTAWVLAHAIILQVTWVFTGINTYWSHNISPPPVGYTEIDPQVPKLNSAPPGKRDQPNQQSNRLINFIIETYGREYPAFINGGIQKVNIKLALKSPFISLYIKTKTIPQPPFNHAQLPSTYR